MDYGRGYLSDWPSINQGLTILVVGGGIILLILRLIFNGGRPIGEFKQKPRRRPAPASGYQLGSPQRDYVPPITIPKTASPPPDVAGRFKVVGVDRDSRLDVTDFVNAESSANAKVKAELAGIVVTSVVLVEGRN